MGFNDYHSASQKASWHKGGSTESIEVLVSRDHDEIVVKFPTGETQRRALSGVKFSQRMKGVPLRIEFKDGSSLVVPDSAVAIRIAQGISNLPSMLERWWLIPFLIILAAGSLYVLVEMVVPKIADAIVPKFSVNMVNEVGKSVYLSFQDSLYTTSDKPEHVDAATKLDEIGMQLASVAGGGYDYRFLLDTKGLLGANAFALPNGHIVMTWELYEIIDEDHVAAVLAHEVAHVTQRHGFAALVRSSAWFVVSTMLFGGVPALNYLPILVELGYSREAELEADCLAITYLEQTGRPAISMAEALEEMGEIVGDSGLEDKWLANMLSTHPGFEQRVDRASQCAGIEVG